MKQTRDCKILIIGSGPAGYTAAIYAARAGLTPVLVQGLTAGGQMTTTLDVENYPGFEQAVEGPWLMEQMENQARKVGAEVLFDQITKADLSQRPFVCQGDSGSEYRAEALIIATGAQARWLGLESEEKFKGAGISACATCDGFFFKGRKVAVIGGGNTAVEEALYLSKLASEVLLIHRRDSLRAEKILQDRLFATDNIHVLWNREVAEFLGELSPHPHLTGLRLRDKQSGALEELSTDGAFVAIGHDPATELFRGQLDCDEFGYIVCEPDSTRTSRPGVFAAGDVRDPIYRQAVTAAAHGCMAALDAQHFLESQQV